MPKHSFDVAKLAKEKGNKAFEAEDYATARLLYSQAMKIDPSQYIYPLNSSIANLKLERWRDAESNATTTLTLAPDHLEALFRRGLARTELHQWSQARQDIQACLDRGGCSVKGYAVLDAITRFEAASSPNPISDRSDDSRSETLGTFPLDDLPGLAIRDSKVDGKGVFATREFKKGDTILCEEPLLTVEGRSLEECTVDVEAVLRKMSPENMAHFLSLHNAHAGGCCAGTLPHHAAEIFQSNLIMLANGRRGVCSNASRFNHSCMPNANHTFDSATGKLRIYAMGAIREGEEISIMYKQSDGYHMNCKPRTERQADLQKLYHFTCACAVCTLPDTGAAQASDARRVRISELADRITRVLQADSESGYVLPDFVECARIFREEGILEGVEEIMTVTVALCAFHSDWASAKYWAEVTYRMLVDQFGEGSELKDFSKCIFQPKSIPYAGLGPQKDFSGFRLD
ncbi:hypothetical protein HYPSUDRAFT_205131 [Hypholoma sublateritium FD-334 SS-4]|uniref:SET domain-containing protein n=1 Tax=Hypholoma sublateritium (strain FD-334 SS-4) TaxID=945553 RepID=A0A0D2M6I1_HYPSF|nr:hypothetical protein HYPSUDRAFT_205131 [Hypholoma sublateritium FD-334 SS-4]